MRKLFKSLFAENEVVDSFAYNLRSKVSNPFFGTLIVVWVIHNWKILYTFFTIDTEFALDLRINKLESVADEVFKLNLFGESFDGFGWNLLLCVFWALGAMMVSFVFLAFSKWVSGVYQDRVLPNIYAKITKNRVKDAKEYYALNDKFNGAREELRKEKEDNVRLEDKLKELKQDNIKLSEESGKLNVDSLELIESNDTLKEELDALKKENIELVDSRSLLEEQFKKIQKDEEQLDSELKKVLNENLKKDDTIDLLEKHVSSSGKNIESLIKFEHFDKKVIEVENLVNDFPNVLRTLKTLHDGGKKASPSIITKMRDVGLVESSNQYVINNKELKSKGYSLTALGRMFVHYFISKGMIEGGKDLINYIELDKANELSKVNGLGKKSDVILLRNGKEIDNESYNSISNDINVVNALTVISKGANIENLHNLPSLIANGLVRPKRGGKGKYELSELGNVIMKNLIGRRIIIDDVD